MTLRPELLQRPLGLIGLLIKAKEKGLIQELNPIFKKWISTGRYFSKKLLNKVLLDLEEKPINW